MFNYSILLCITVSLTSLIYNAASAVRSLTTTKASSLAVPLH